MAIRAIAQNCLQPISLCRSSAARAFLQIGPRRYQHNTTLLALDFLLPNISSGNIGHVRIDKPVSSRSPQNQPSRTFTTSSFRRQTSAIINPRKDDDGNEMNIEITARASRRLAEIMFNDANPNLALRIQVESGGCHGFQYLMSLTTLPLVDMSTPSSSIREAPTVALKSKPRNPNAISSNLSTPHVFKSESVKSEDSKIGHLNEDDTVFAVSDGSQAKVVMDGPSLELLKGSKIDYTMELIGSQFKIVDNPLATSSCGCGTSFDIKN